MGPMATSDGVHTQRLYFKERDGKDHRKMQTQTLHMNVSLGSIHTCDLLDVDYSLNNGLCCTNGGPFTLTIWSTLAWTEKFNNGLCTHF